MRLRFLILCVLSMTIQTLTAQIDHSILDSGLVWRYRYSGGSSAPGWSNVDVRIGRSDTTINGRSYFKLRHPYWIAEDTLLHQIWIYSSDSVAEAKIIDFEANIGDSLNLSTIGFISDFAVVKDTTITVTLNNGELRKAMKVDVIGSSSFGSNVDSIYWIDGIGSSNGIEYFDIQLISLNPTGFSCVFNESQVFEDLYGNCALSVSELSDASFQLSVWPNPAKDVLNMEADSPMEEIRVYDQLGSLAFRYQPSAISGLEQIDVSNFKPGLYFLMVKTEKGVETKKVIIER